MPFRRRGFTLIELLVVIAIVMILAAILFPVFARVRENGRRAACQSNLKQIGLALTQYSQDYDETFIADWYGGNGATEPAGTLTSNGNEYKWYDAAFPYIKSEQIFNCPSQSFSDPYGPYIYYGKLTMPDTKYGSYAIVHGYGPQNAGCPTGADCTPPVSHPLIAGAPHQFVRLSEAATPATTAWAVDSTGYFCIGVTTAARPIPRHLETVNVLFLDGHVKALRNEILQATNSQGTIRAYTLQDD